MLELYLSLAAAESQGGVAKTVERCWPASQDEKGGKVALEPPALFPCIPSVSLSDNGPYSSPNSLMTSSIGNTVQQMLDERSNKRLAVRWLSAE